VGAAIRPACPAAGALVSGDGLCRIRARGLLGPERALKATMSAERAAGVLESPAPRAITETGRYRSANQSKAMTVDSTPTSSSLAARLRKPDPRARSGVGETASGLTKE